MLILLNQLNESMRAKLLFLWWRVWHLRNNIIFGDGKCGKKPTQELILRKEFMACIPSEIWKYPSPGWAKLNSDASFIESNGTGSWGAILRNERGEVMITAWGPLPHCINAGTAEALGLLNGVRAILPMYAGRIRIENDNASLINELNLNVRSKSAIADIAQDIKNLLSSFEEAICGKVNRSANKVADVLARLGRSVSSECLLLGSAPPCVAEALMHDCKLLEPLSM
ncbi:unnamed protein product [Alopecurus aequalis]